MITSLVKSARLGLVIAVIFAINTGIAIPCSTFKLSSNDNLVYGHNLNQGDIGVPGLIFINKRSVYKMGKTWDELISTECSNKSDFTWISRYGSVTFNSFGRDLPDGGINEAGLFVWEMSEDVQYPRNTSLPKLNQMQWIQFLLDNHATTKEAIRCASEFEIDGWGWHFFIGDASGDVAVVSFKDGKVITYTGSDLPIPVLCNSPYERELELSRYYVGFGGQYEINTHDPKIPRFVRAAELINKYEDGQDIVEYGLAMLDRIKVNDIPEWSILYSSTDQKLFYRTRLSPDIKIISIEELDFSNNSDTRYLDIDSPEKGHVNPLFASYNNDVMKTFTKNKIVPILPESFFTEGGLNVDEYVERLSTYNGCSSIIENQFFCGRWKSKSGLEINIKSSGDRISGTASNPKSTYKIDHIAMIGNRLKFTFITDGGTFIEIKAVIDDNQMEIETLGIEDHFGTELLMRG